MPNDTASDLTGCDEEVPLLGVTREFDFGQFIELFDETEDPLHLGTPILSRIVIQPSAKLASDRNAAISAQAAVTAGFTASTPRVLPQGGSAGILSPTPPQSSPSLQTEVHLFDLALEKRIPC